MNTEEQEQPQVDDLQLYEVVCPLTGEIVNTHDADELAAAWLRMKEQEQRLDIFKQQLCDGLMSLATLPTDGSKTCRVRGSQCRIKLELPKDYWDNAILKEAFLAYPHLRDAYLRIERVAVKAVEYKKMLHESGTPDFEQFRKMVCAANLGPRGLPYVTIEETQNPWQEQLPLEQPVDDSVFPF